MLSTDDTIVAIASAHGGAARGIVRVSGPHALACAVAAFEPLDPARAVEDTLSAKAIPGVVHVPVAAGLPALDVPAALFVWPDARSFTRQPSVELHIPGSPTLAATVAEHLQCCGARSAQPGEFTLRAFLAGRIDLTQAEAVLGVVDAQSQIELDAALAQLAGGLTRPLHQLRHDLLALSAELEAGLDFVEEDIEFVSRDALSARFGMAAATVDAARRQLTMERQRPAVPCVALMGRPNAGKSRLFNALAAVFCGSSPTRSALVADLPGTTRDYVTALLECDDVVWELVDTAGLATPLDAPTEGTATMNEAIGAPSRSEFPSAPGESRPCALTIDFASQQMASQRIERADLRLWCVDASAGPERSNVSLPRDTLLVWTKIDLLDSTKRQAAEMQSPTLLDSCAPLAVSSVTSTGVVELGGRISQFLTEKGAESLSLATAPSTAQRCAGSLQRAAESLQSAQELLAMRGGDELIAAELRSALDALGDVVGTTCVDDVLDRIFSQFCIGK